MFALAGYLIHDIHEVAPVIILDSLEAIDSARTARVVEYFQTYTEYLVVALLPEDVEMLSEQYAYVTDVE